MKKLFTFIIFLFCTPTAHSAAALERHEVAPYVDLARAAQIREKVDSMQISYPGFNYEHVTLLRNADALESTSMTSLEKLNAICYNECWEDRKAIIQYMIKNGVKANTIIYHYDSTTPLHESIMHRDFAFASYLLNHGADPNQHVIVTGTPLERVIYYLNNKDLTKPSDFALLKLLIFNNANPDLISQCRNRPIRKNANPGICTLIEQIEQEKQKNLTQNFLTLGVHMPCELAQITISYLDANFKTTPEVITQVKANRDTNNILSRLHTIAKVSLTCALISYLLYR